MNWPRELIIKRDITNTKVENSKDIILFIETYNNIGVLENYLSSLKAQTKLNQNEVIDIIESTENRINYLNKELETFKTERGNSNDLVEFYETNIYFINKLINDYIETNIIGNSAMEIIIDFLRFSIGREKDSYQNKLQTQNTFNKFYNFYKTNKNSIKDDKYKDILDDIIEARDIILNKKDESAMEYSEKGYTKVLSNGQYKILNEDEPTKLGSAAFITTAIVLQATLALTLIMSLLALVK